MSPLQIIVIVFVVVLGFFLTFAKRKRRARNNDCEQSGSVRRSISKASCYGIIITSLIALCLLIIPINEQPAFLSMPIVGDGSIVIFNELMLAGFDSLLHIGDGLFDFLSIVLEYGSTVYMFTPVLTSIMAIIMLFAKSDSLRRIFRFICIFLGVAMVINMLAQLVVVIGVVGVIADTIKFGSRLNNLTTVLFPLLMFYASSFLSKKLLKWFN